MQPNSKSVCPSIHYNSQNKDVRCYCCGRGRGVEEEGEDGSRGRWCKHTLVAPRRSNRMLRASARTGANLMKSLLQGGVGLDDGRHGGNKSLALCFVAQQIDEIGCGTPLSRTNAPHSQISSGGPALVLATFPVSHCIPCINCVRLQTLGASILLSV